MFNISRSLIAVVAIGSASALSAPVLAQTSPVAGSWEVTMQTPVGERTSTVTFAPAGGAYTVAIADPAMDGPPPESTISEVRVDGNSFSFKRSLVIEQGPIALTYSGTVDGNALTGKVDSDFGAFDIKGTRTGS